MLGPGEAGNDLGGIKIVTEWYPLRERAFAGGIFTRGANIGAAIAAPLVATITPDWGWRAAFISTGTFGFPWLVAWFLFHGVPAKHGKLTPEERVLLAKHLAEGQPRQTSRCLHPFQSRQVWPLRIARFPEEPLICLRVLWIPQYMVDRHGRSLLETGRVPIVPYISLDIGSVSGGRHSGHLVRGGAGPTGRPNSQS